MKQATQTLLQESDALINEVNSYLTRNGVTFNLSEWITLKEYARRYGLDSTNVVSNWISRGIIPSENVQEFPDLNGLKLVRAIPYREKIA